MTTISPDTLHKLLRYEPETGKLFWLPRPIEMFSYLRTANSWNARLAGREAGADHSCGYRDLDIFGKRHYAHRVIWAMQTGSWPVNFIDHINGVKNDNRIENLREATAGQNRRNSSLNKNNASGFKGVSFLPERGKWQAHIGVNGKQKALGLFDCPKAAHAAYQKAATDFYGEFARFA